MIHSRIHKLAATGLFLSVCGWGTPAAQAGDDGSVTMKPVRVALFKNGYGFITMRGKTGSEASMKLKNLPVPAFGTFWVSAASPAKITCLVSSRKEEKRMLHSGSMVDFANANPGKQIRVITDGGVVEGTVISGRGPATDEENPNIIGGEATLRDETRPSTPFLIVRTAAGTVVLSSEKIKQLEFSDPNTQLPSKTVSLPCVELALEKPAPGSVLTATSVSYGVSWIPSYHLDMTEAGRATMSVKASVINELMDFEGVDLDLITGVPTLKYPDLASPLSMKLELWQFLGGLSGSSPVPIALTSNRIDEGFMSVKKKESWQAPAIATRAEDLFYYPVSKFTCKRNETVTFPLFSGEVPYKTVYTWEIPNQRELARFANVEDLAQDPSRDIWHCVRLDNTFNMPLTTGVVEFTNSSRFAGQGTMMYTAPGESATVKLNKSMDIVTERSEKIMERREAPNSKERMLNVVYGTLEIRNLSGKIVPLEITKKILGVPQSASEGGICTTEPNWTGSINPNGTIKWNLTLPSDGKPVTVSYFYDYVE